MIPFAMTVAQRLAPGDPRLSLTERYGNQAGYVAAVTAAAHNAMAQGFLLQADHVAAVCFTRRFRREHEFAGDT